MREEYVLNIGTSEQITKVYYITMERENDSRIIADIELLPGVLAYGETQSEAALNVKALALRVIADKLDHGEMDNIPDTISFIFRYKHKEVPNFYVFSSRPEDELL